MEQSLALSEEECQPLQLGAPERESKTARFSMLTPGVTAGSRLNFCKHQNDFARGACIMIRQRLWFEHWHADLRR